MAEKKIDKYHFLLSAVLGVGSFAKVYKGVNMLTKEPIAIKMVDKQMINSDDYLRQGLIAEIRIMQILKSENVVRLFDVLETTNNYYLIQEYCDGEVRVLKIRKQLTEQEAILFFIDILKGFVELIKHGIVHRDLKPANILIHQGCFKLADFGFAKCVENFNTGMLATAVGTPLYMSPQILQNERYTNKTDIWSLGFIFYETLYQKPPWNGVSIPQLLGNIKRIELKFPPEPEVSGAIKNLISGCLRIEENDRFCWDQIYKHPFFENKFGYLYNNEQNIVDPSTYVTNELRQKIFQENIDIKEVLKLEIRDPNNLTKDEVKTLILRIDQEMPSDQVEVIYKKFKSNSNANITILQVKLWFEQQKKSVESTKLEHQRSLEESKLTNDNQNMPHLLQQPGIYQYGNDIPMAFFKINSALNTQKQTIDEVFKSYMKDPNCQVTSRIFYVLFKKIDQNLTDQEIEQAFKYMDTDHSGQFTVQHFIDNLKNTLQKIQGQDHEAVKNSWGNNIVVNKPKSNSAFSFLNKKKGP